jgi:L,D-transpeptidase ErfK/SrfK
MKTTTVRHIIVLCLLVLIPALAPAAVIVGSETIYSIVPGDSLLLVSAKLGVDMKAVARENNLKMNEPLQPGRELRVNTRKIAPKLIDNGIIIDISGRMLYYFESGRVELSFPVGLGMSAWQGMTIWKTPSGIFTIIRKAKDPVWYVPESIQMQMQMEGKPVVTRVPPGPDNPLGRYVLYTSLPGIEIHETTSPTSVYRYRSHGCIRVLSQHIVPFFEKVEKGTPGELVYEPVKAAVMDGWRVYLEVDSDVYGKVKNVMDEVNERLGALNVDSAVCWEKVLKVIQERSGSAEDVTLLPKCVLQQ